MHELTFARLLEYDAGNPGISLRVELRLGGEAISVEAKIDTGSSVCIFERSLGEALGLNIESGRPETIRTVTGLFQVFAHEVTLNTEGFEFDSEVYFAAHQDFHVNVLGRLGWLDQLVVAINDYEGKLYLSPYNA